MYDAKQILGLVTVALGVIAYVPYIKDTVKGRTKPHVYTWFVWGLVTLVIFALQLTNGAQAGSWVTLVVGLLSLLICILGLQQGDRDITKSDTCFFVAALCALGLWLLADQAVVSMILLVSIGMLGFVPTVRKSWNRPHTETVSTYALNSIRHFLSFFALSQYSIVTWLFPVSWTIANGLFALSILVRRKIVAE